MALRVSVRVEEAKATMVLQGWFDFSAQRVFKTAWDELSDRSDLSEIDLDFRDVTFLDSTALGMLLVAQEQSEKVERSLALVNCSRSVRLVLDRAKLDRLLKIT